MHHKEGGGILGKCITWAGKEPHGASVLGASTGVMKSDYSALSEKGFLPGGRGNEKGEGAREGG